MLFLMRAAMIEDAALIAPHLRSEDKQELEAGDSGLSITERLTIGLGASTEAFAFSLDGLNLVMLGGIMDGLTGSVIWMVCTPSAEKYPLSLIDTVKPIIDKWTEDRPFPLVCAVDRRNRTHKKWLKLLGFSDPVKTVMRGKLPFDLMYYERLVK